MRPITVSVGPLATASANNIALSQTPAGAGAMTLNGTLATGGVATLDNPRRVLITTADTTTVFTITGTSPTGTVLTESGKATAGTYASALDYATVTSISVNQGTTAAVTIGTNGIGSTPWVRFDEWASPAISIQCNLTGSANYTIQATLDDPNSATNAVVPSAVTWVATSDAAGVGATTSVQSNFAYVPVFARVLLNSGTGSVSATFVQSGVVPR